MLLQTVLRKFCSQYLTYSNLLNYPQKVLMDNLSLAVNMDDNMAEEKATIMRRYFEALNVGDISSALALFTNDCVVTGTHVPYFDDTGKIRLPLETFVGIEALTTLIKGAISSNVNINLTKIDVVGDRVTAQGTIYTTYYANVLHKPQLRAYLAMTIRQGQIADYDLAIAYEEIVELQRRMDATGT